MKRQGCHIAKAFFLRFVLPQLPGLWVARCVIDLRKRPELLLIPFMFLGSTSMLQVQAQTLAGPSYSEWRISPGSIAIQQGSYSGSLTALATKDQTGTQNNSANYVQFGTPSGQQFSGYLSFTAPSGITLSQITSIQLMANVLAPQDTVDRWIAGATASTTGRALLTSTWAIRTIAAVPPGCTPAGMTPGAFSTGGGISTMRTAMAQSRITSTPLLARSASNWHLQMLPVMRIWIGYPWPSIRVAALARFSTLPRTSAGNTNSRPAQQTGLLTRQHRGLTRSFARSLSRAVPASNQ
jgi:hypothetical protein